MKSHKCKGFNNQKTHGWTYESLTYFNIKKNVLWAESEYGLEIKFCPLCGKDLQEKDKQ